MNNFSFSWQCLPLLREDFDGRLCLSPSSVVVVVFSRLFEHIFLLPLFSLSLIVFLNVSRNKTASEILCFFPFSRSQSDGSEKSTMRGGEKGCDSRWDKDNERSKRRKEEGKSKVTHKTDTTVKYSTEEEKTVEKKEGQLSYVLHTMM